MSHSGSVYLLKNPFKLFHVITLENLKENV